ncbi:uncharacterized protein LOC113225702 isoform X2 [Hyposmocoma kahamanoa]|uniref:uncharacterized protein LOC113225702 isoform X2 n=1 Tax=Hyposmocoma kahamanoa TaxID=1477025 RepID=UPI000E6D62B3|nr:uncharacterized protein LOC113225702 isoform X2 [Hyposmocoma kahamanoa]
MRQLHTIVAFCLILAASAVENIEPIAESEEREPQTRAERCTTCGTTNFKSPNQVLAHIQSLPGAEVHTQQSFEECSSDKGCAGIKVKDGKVIERFGNADAFKAAAAADLANEFQFHVAGSNVFDGGIPNAGPYWWMSQNSPFKAGASAGGGNFEKFSQSSSSFSSSGNTAGGGAQFGGAGGQFGGSGGQIGGSIDLSANPFLNGEFSKIAGSFGGGQEVKPSTFQSSSFESSSFSTSNKGGIDLSKNPYLNAGANKFQGAGFQASGAGFASGNQNQNFGQGFSGQGSSGSKFASSSGYVGSSPSPFTASTSGNNLNLIQNTQKTSEFDFEQQNQQNIDEVFQGTGNVHAHEHSGGDLQQTCAGQGYVCVHKAQCNNGVVNTNGAAVLQAKTKKQYCNTKTEICCRIEISTLSGAGGLQGSLGVGSATFQGSGSQGSGLFVSSSQGSSASGANAFGQSGQSGITGQSGQSGQSGQGQATFGSSGSSFESSSSSFGNRNQGSGISGQGGQGAQGGQSSRGVQGFGVSGTFESGSSGFNNNNFGAGANGVNRGVTVETSSSSFESSSRGSSGFGGNKGFGSNGGSFGAGFGTTGTSLGAAGGSVNTGGVTNTNSVYKQTNFIETDSFSSGSEVQGVYRPGASGSGLKPGIPYLPPVDSSSSGSSFVGSTYSPTTFVTSPRPPPTLKPTYLPPVVSTAAPGYLPPQVPEQSINTETRVPNPSYDEGQIILDENRFPKPKPTVPFNNEIPSGCAAALKCTPIEYCTAEGVISNTTVILTKDQDAYRVPLTDCKDVESGRVGKCCRDPYYTDPWPTNQLGQWVSGVFGGNDGKYVPDSRGSGSISRPQVTARPPVTGSTVLNNFRTPKPTLPPFGPNQVTPGFPSSSSSSSFAQKGQFEVRGQGGFGQGGIGSFGQGGQGQFGVAGQGQAAQGGQSQFASGSQFSQSSSSFGQQRGQGQLATQGQFAQGGRGQFSVGGLGQTEIQESGAQGQFTQTQNQKNFEQTLISGQGQGISQGFGQGVRQGQGLAVSRGGGFGVENEYSESSLRVFLQQYSAGGQCGVFNGQKPYGNRNELEVDFAEIPWQAMVLLQTNKSLLCGGVITRPDVVVTSASCVEGLDARNVLIKGGEWKLGIDDEPLPFQIVQVKNILRHPFYKTGSLHNDAAILVLTENLRLAKNIYPICLPRAGETLDAFYNGAGECIITGWGKQVLQAHLAGSIMHSLNISLINPGECQAKLQQDYPHLLEQYDQESCACGQPTNPVNNICKVDIGSALACTTGDGHFVLRGVYSWDSGCQLGNQLAAFYKFDLEWYEWAIGLIESARFAQYNSGSALLSQNRFAQINTGLKGGSFAGQSSGIKGGFAGVKGAASGVKGAGFSQSGFGQGQSGFAQGQSGFGQNQFSQSQYNQFSSSEAANVGSSGFNAQIKGPITNSYSASFAEKKVFQSEPKIVTFTTKPEIVTFTTKPEYFTYTTKPKLVTFTTKPQLITYETSGSGTNPQYVAPGVTFNPSFSEVVGTHQHSANCKCVEGKK